MFVTHKCPLGIDDSKTADMKKKYVINQGQGLKVNFFYQEGLATKNTHVKYESLITYISKVMARLIFSKSRSNSKVGYKVKKTGIQWSCFKEKSCEI